jgi:transcriptional regulator with XRE-family HTH domain
MLSRKLPNYLRTWRKRSGLSQKEVAFLLGCRYSNKVSHYERFTRQPNLETVFACEALFGVPARELFAGMYQKVEETIRQRGQILVEKLNVEKPDRITRWKLENLTAMTSLRKPETSHYGVSLNQ